MKHRLFVLSLLIMIGFWPLRSLAFSPNYIMSDWDLTDAFSMDFNQIQHFLQRGYLADYVTEDWTGQERYAADIILRAAQTYGISPKFLLVLLQKEQSLVEDDYPTQNQLDWATGYAVCDDCSKDDPNIQRWRGFGKQVNSAAMQFTEGYLLDIEEYGVTQGKYGPDMPIEIDGVTVTPENAATAALYAYTPHLHGNQNFATIWERWFTVTHPTGTLLKLQGEPGIFLIEYGYKRPIMSWSAFLSRFNPSLLIEAPKNVLDNYPDGRPISFPNYSLLQDDNGHIYLLVDDALRHIDSMATFYATGFMEDEIVQVSNADLAYFDRGEPITSETAHPQGTLLQLPTGTVYYIQDGLRHPIVDKAILDARFANRAIIQTTAAEVEQYFEGPLVTFPDGYLIKSETDPTVYIVSEGERRPIGSETVFLSYGYSWDRILTVNEVALNAHPLGPAVEEPIN